jgi:hypothetical protein
MDEPALARCCPFCARLVMADNAGMYHERPACAEWVAKMAELGASPGQPVHALVVRLSEKEDAN